MSSVLITGASRGIGRATALALDRAGHDVIACVRHQEAADHLAAEASGRLRTVRLDVTDARSVRAAADAVGGRLDALVNNAGVVVGGDARGRVLLKAALPDRAFDALAARTTGA